MFNRYRSSAKNFDAFPADAKGVIVNLLRAANASPIRQNLLRVSPQEGEIGYFQGASPEEQKISIAQLKNDPALSAAQEMDDEQVEKLYGLFKHNFHNILKRNELEGQVPSWDMFQQAVSEALGGPVQQLQQHRQDLEKHLDRLRNDKKHKEEIERLEQQIQSQKKDFDEKLQARDDKKENDEQPKKSEPQAPQSEGYAALLQQANRYDIKTIAIMGILDLLFLPVNIGFRFVGAVVQERPTTPGEWIEVLKTWGKNSYEDFERNFGFGSRGASHGDDMAAQAAQNQAAQSQNRPKPPGPNQT